MVTIIVRKWTTIDWKSGGLLTKTGTSQRRRLLEGWRAGGRAGSASTNNGHSLYIPSIHGFSLWGGMRRDNYHNIFFQDLYLWTDTGVKFEEAVIRKKRRKPERPMSALVGARRTFSLILRIRFFREGGRVSFCVEHTVCVCVGILFVFLAFQHAPHMVGFEPSSFSIFSRHRVYLRRRRQYTYITKNTMYQQQITGKKICVHDHVDSTATHGHFLLLECEACVSQGHNTHYIR